MCGLPLKIFEQEETEETEKTAGDLPLEAQESTTLLSLFTPVQTATLHANGLGVACLKQKNAKDAQADVFFAIFAIFC